MIDERTAEATLLVITYDLEQQKKKLREYLEGYGIQMKEKDFGKQSKKIVEKYMYQLMQHTR